jgi:hypothetical protein
VVVSPPLLIGAAKTAGQQESRKPSHPAARTPPTRSRSAAFTEKYWRTFTYSTKSCCCRTTVTTGCADWAQAHNVFDVSAIAVRSTKFIVLHVPIVVIICWMCLRSSSWQLITNMVRIQYVTTSRQQNSPSNCCRTQWWSQDHVSNVRCLRNYDTV